MTRQSLLPQSRKGRTPTFVGQASKRPFKAMLHSLQPLNVDEGEGNFFLKPNGVFAMTASGAAVIETSAYSKLASMVKLATQSGPLLLHGGQINAAFKPGSVSRLRRNGVCVRSPGKVAFVITDGPVNLYEFAAFFRDALACQDAQYLDGAVSALSAPCLGAQRCAGGSGADHRGDADRSLMLAEEPPLACFFRRLPCTAPSGGLVQAGGLDRSARCGSAVVQLIRLVALRLLHPLKSPVLCRR